MNFHRFGRAHSVGVLASVLFVFQTAEVQTFAQGPANRILPVEPPLISITAVDPEARELPLVVSAIDPATFRLERTGEAVGELTVFFSVDGSATADRDYKALGRSALFRAGERTVDLLVMVIGDDQVEGDESVVVRLEPDPSMGPIEHYRITPDRSEAKAVIHDDDGPGPDRTLIRIEAVAPQTPEFCPPNARCMPGRFVITRVGSMTEAQPVFLWLGGSARNGEDYQLLPFLVTIPAGKPSADVIVAPLDDELAEGDETVSAELSQCPRLRWASRCRASGSRLIRRTPRRWLASSTTKAPLISRESKSLRLETVRCSRPAKSSGSRRLRSIPEASSHDSSISRTVPE